MLTFKRPNITELSEFKTETPPSIVVASLITQIIFYANMSIFSLYMYMLYKHTSVFVHKF